MSHITPDIALLIDTATSWGTGLLRGIANYAKRSGPWFFYVEPRGKHEKLEIPSGWKGQGIIARINNSMLADQILKSKIPCVNVSWFNYSGPNIVRCTSNEWRIGQLAATHLLERGLTCFAYCGLRATSNVYREELKRGFIEEISKEGYMCYIHKAGPQVASPRAWGERRDRLGDWLKTLPKPLGLLAWNDARGRQVAEACRYAGLRVPEEVAIIGGERDNLMSNISFPQLTSVNNAPQRVGYEAAALLDKMMQGQAPPESTVLVEPGEIITRQSTDIVAFDDPYIAKAAAFIRENACKGIDVPDVVKKVPLSRRAFEQRFKVCLGRSPAAAIRHIRLQKSRSLLGDTNWTIAQIADASGFHTALALTRAFKRQFGESPSFYRKKARRK